jgi:cation-transporting ATPase 13A1
MIVTCVIPPSLPMQTAMAVNSAVLTLMKMNIFCTEPYRIPTGTKALGWKAIVSVLFVF